MVLDNNQMPNEQQNQDEILIKKAMNGDKSAFGMLIGKYKDKLYNMLFFMVHNREDALDLLQDTLLKAYKSIHRLRCSHAFSSWITKIGVNLALNYLKKNEKNKKYQEKLVLEYKVKDENPLYHLEKEELKTQLSKLIAELPAKQRVALILCDIEGYSYKEISEILKCRIGTVMSRIYYAREYIRNSLSICEKQKSIRLSE